MRGIYQTLTAILRAGAEEIQHFPESGSSLAACITAGMVFLRDAVNGDGTDTWTGRPARPWKSDLRLFMRLRGVLHPQGIGGVPCECAPPPALQEERCPHR